MRGARSTAYFRFGYSVEYWISIAGFSAPDG